jgi:hypothetical protein
VLGAVLLIPVVVGVVAIPVVVLLGDDVSVEFGPTLIGLAFLAVLIVLYRLARRLVDDR